MHILLMTPLDPEQEARLKAVIPERVVLTRDRTEKAPITAILGGPPPEFIQHLHHLDWVQFRSDSLEAWADTLRVLAHRRVTVTRTRGSYNATVPDHAMMMLLALARDFPRLCEQRRAHAFDHQALRPKVLAGATVAVLGMGRIGTAVATRALAFGLRVIGVDPRPESVPEGVADVLPSERLGEALEQAEFVIVTVPHTPGTVGLLGAENLARMPAGSYLINIGRGVAVDTKALLAALDDGHLAGAALDVVEPNKLPEAHPLWEHPNVILTGHSAPVGSDGAKAQFEIILENTTRYVEGRELTCQVDLSEWA